MEKKIIEYGTQHQVKVLSATEKLITAIGDDGEGYLLMGHGIKELPKEGDSGKITFLKKNIPAGVVGDKRARINDGYWHYEKI